LGSAGYTATADAASGKVTITTKEPFSDLLLGLAMPWASIVCPAGLNDLDAMKSKAFGSGPFTLQDSVRGSKYTLVARPGYHWGPGGMSTSASGFPQKVVMKLVDNESTVANLLLTGALDAGYITGKDVERVANNKRFTQIKAPVNGAEYLAFNESAGLPGSDPKVREAFARAVDAAAWNKAETFGQGEVALSYITPSVPCYADESAIIPPYDPDGAKALLRQAGWVLGPNGKLSKGGKPLVIRLLGVNIQNAGPEYLASALTDIGVTVKSKVLSLDAYVGVVFGKSGEWDVTPFPFGPPMPSPNTITAFVSGPSPADGGSNLGGIHNTAFESARLAALASVGNDRCAHWQDAQAALIQSVDIKPLSYYPFQWFTRGVQLRPLGGGLMMPIAVTG
jgi:peptide/nickel transport system substrate-binding protein